MGRLISNNSCFVANTRDAKTLDQLSIGVKEPVGRVGWVRSGDEGTNSFIFDQSANL